MKTSLWVDDLDCLLYDTVSLCLCIPVFRQNTVTESSRQPLWKPQISLCAVWESVAMQWVFHLVRQHISLVSTVDVVEKCGKGHRHLPNRCLTKVTDPFWVKAPETHLIKFPHPSSETGKLYVQAQSRLQLWDFCTASPATSLVCKNG
jgi:hypothetical protein